VLGDRLLVAGSIVASAHGGKGITWSFGYVVLVK
jgi:hypothetical protein